MTRSVVTPIGCLTSDWQSRIRITARVRRELETDPSLTPVLWRALGNHEGKLHRILPRDGFVSTVAWLRRGRKLNGCVIASHCTPHLSLGTVVDFARVVAPR